MHQHENGPQENPQSVKRALQKLEKRLLEAEAITLDVEGGKSKSSSIFCPLGEEGRKEKKSNKVVDIMDESVCGRILSMDDDIALGSSLNCE